MFWPDVDTLEEARKATRTAAWIAAFCAAVTLVMAIYALATGEKVFEWVSAWSLVDGALFLVIAYGIYRESRVAAVAGLLFYLLEQITSIMSAPPGTIRTSFTMLIFLFAFISGIRGTFALHRLARERRTAEELASVSA